jgi:hypothetical protein
MVGVRHRFRGTFVATGGQVTIGAAGLAQLWTAEFKLPFEEIHLFFAVKADFERDAVGTGR